MQAAGKRLVNAWYTPSRSASPVRAQASRSASPTRAHDVVTTINGPRRGEAGSNPMRQPWQRSVSPLPPHLASQLQRSLSPMVPFATDVARTPMQTDDERGRSLSRDVGKNACGAKNSYQERPVVNLPQSSGCNTTSSRPAAGRRSRSPDILFYQEEAAKKALPPWMRGVQVAPKMDEIMKPKNRTTLDIQGGQQPDLHFAGKPDLLPDANPIRPPGDKKLLPKKSAEFFTTSTVAEDNGLQVTKAGKTPKEERSNRQKTHELIDHPEEDRELERQEAEHRFRSSYTHQHAWDHKSETADRSPSQLKAQKEQRRKVPQLKIGQNKDQNLTGSTSEGAALFERRFPGDTTNVAGSGNIKTGNLRDDPERKLSKKVYQPPVPENKEVDARLRDKKLGFHHPADLEDFRIRAKSRQDHISPDNGMSHMSPIRHSKGTVQERRSPSPGENYKGRNPQLESDHHTQMHDDDGTHLPPKQRTTWAELNNEQNEKRQSLAHAYKHENHRPERCALERNRGSIGDGVHGYTSDMRDGRNHWEHHPHAFDRKKIARETSLFNLRQAKIDKELNDARKYGVVNIKPYGVYEPQAWRRSRLSPRDRVDYPTQFAAFGGQRALEGTVKPRYDHAIPRGRAVSLDRKEAQHHASNSNKALSLWQQLRAKRESVSLKVTDPHESEQRRNNGRFAHKRAKSAVVERRSEQLLEKTYQKQKKPAEAADWHEAYRARSMQPELRRVKPQSDLKNHEGIRYDLERKLGSQHSGITNVHLTSSDAYMSIGAVKHDSPHRRSRTPRTPRSNTSRSPASTRPDMLNRTAESNATAGDDLDQSENKTPQNYYTGNDELEGATIAGAQINQEITPRMIDGDEHLPRGVDAHPHHRGPTDDDITMAKKLSKDIEVHEEMNQRHRHPSKGKKRNFDDLVITHAGQRGGSPVQKKAVPDVKHFLLESDHAGAKSERLTPSPPRMSEKPLNPRSPYLTSVEKAPSRSPPRHTRGDSLTREVELILETGTGNLLVGNYGTDAVSTAADYDKTIHTAKNPLSSAAFGGQYKISRDISPVLRARDRNLVGKPVRQVMQHTVLDHPLDFNSRAGVLSSHLQDHHMVTLMFDGEDAEREQRKLRALANRQRVLVHAPPPARHRSSREELRAIRMQAEDAKLALLHEEARSLRAAGTVSDLHAPGAAPLNMRRLREEGIRPTTGKS
ncbi:unnamed protein product [Amoebophrya sp. A120]|nr:unnamed protein product [Amoebophrya sp. A120]|eukprot:GSA120T00011422001.1